jgi:predicted MFS family arabinose efflux permease
LFALLMVPRVVSESRMVRISRHIDVAGTVTVTGGLVAVVDGLLQAASHPWGSWQVLLPLLGGVGLLAAMLGLESRAAEPLIPVRFFANRTRVTANVLTAFMTSAFISYVFLLTLYEQQVLGYSPLKAGLLYLPLGVGIGAGIGVGTGLMPRIGVKTVLFIGFTGFAAGLLIASFIRVDSSYVGGILPTMIVVGVFSGMCFPPVVNAALHQVTGQDSSLASGVQTATQYVGEALGLACLVTLALRHAAGQERAGVLPATAATQGYAVAFRVGAIVLAVGAVLTLVLLERVSATPRNPLADATPNQLAGLSITPTTPKTG